MGQIKKTNGHVSHGMAGALQAGPSAGANKDRAALTDPDLLQELRTQNADLLKSRQFYSLLVQGMPQPIVVTDPDDLIILFNRAATDLFGWREDEVAGCLLGRILARENPPELLATLKHERCANRVWRGELRGRTNSEDAPRLSMVVSPVINEKDETVAVMYLVTDVTETRRLQNLNQQMERMTLQSEMASNVSHTMNNFLAVLSGSVELLPLMLSSGKTDKVNRRLKIMQSTLEKIQTFCEGLKDRCSGEPRRTTQDMNALVLCLVGYLRPQDQYSDIHIQITPGEGLPPVHVSVIQMQQVIASLIKNAAEAISHQSIQDGRIDVVTRLAADGNSLQISVSDNGEGIPKAMIETLSQRRHSSRPGGRGLSLVTARRVLEDHGGRIKLESELGKGSTITLYLPVSDTSQDPETEEVRGDPSCAG